ncbi:MAG: glycosyltransferase [Tannerellaceae bacterium]|jgi:glycosyltransferase involved in cell wall biosynthesis|nr:glycosyltransferase [Tannerellaceae bacterium]
MKIAMLSAFYPFRGGIAQFNANLYEALKKENDVCPYTFRRQYPDFLFPGKTQYITAGDNALPVKSIPVLDTANPFTYLSAAGQIKKEKPDILLMKYWMSYFAPSLGVVAGSVRKNGTKTITILDNVIPHEQKFFDKALTTWFLKQNDGFIAMSGAVRDDLLLLHPKARSILKPHPLYNHFGDKVETAKAREALGTDVNKKTILFFGLIRDYKGLDLLIDAVSLLDDSYQLIIAGEAYGSFDKYDERIKKANHPERIKVFNRYISDNEVPLFFSAADVCVLPYRSATQSGITSIAYHFELPLIATNTGGLKESIEKPGAGLIIPEISATSIAETIQQFFHKDKNIFISNIRKEKSLLTWEHFAETLLSFAKEL